MQAKFVMMANALHQLSLDQVALLQACALPNLIVTKMQVNFVSLENVSHQLLLDQVVLILLDQMVSLLLLDLAALLPDFARLIPIVTKMQTNFVMLANVLHQLSLDQVVLILLDQEVYLPLLDLAALLQDFAKPVPTVTKMQAKFVMLANASCLLL
jgi:hypothetical protein